MSENLKYYERFRKVPEEAKKKITGGRLSGMSDINPMWRIKTLTEQFGICGIGWKYSITKQWIETGGKDEKAAFTNIELFIKVGSEWSDAIPGTGGSSFIAAEKNGLYTSDECFKMALTDALSVACKSLGIGADVYFEKDRTKYDAKPEQPPQKPIIPQIDEAVLQSIKNALSECKSHESLKKMWEANPELHKNTTFIKLVTDRKKVLTDNGIS